MLKLILAQLGLTITQEQVENALREAKAAYDAVQDMKASQLRCEAMLTEMAKVKYGWRALEEMAIDEERDRNAPLQNITVLSSPKFVDDAGKPLFGGGGVK